MITGIDPQTFELVSDWDYVSKTLLPDALSTRQGSRILQRELGSRPEALLDKPGNAATIAEATIAYAETFAQIVHRETGFRPVRFKGIGVKEQERDGRHRIAFRLDDMTAEGTGREVIR